MPQRRSITRWSWLLNEIPDRRAITARIGWFHGRGHKAEHVFELGMIGASDEEIAAHASANDVVLISKDEDFVTLRLPDRFSFLWLRCGNATNRALIAWLEPRWSQIESWLVSGERFVEVR